MMSRPIKFNYILETNEQGSINRKSITLDYVDIFSGRASHELNPQARIGYAVLEKRQYTGLKDKNGVEIYEGDVVAYDTEDGICAATVTWSDDVDPSRDLSPLVGPGYVYTSPFQWREYADDEDAIGLEVIGNIYENPELLEDKS